jgi:hypothetical protein
LQDQPLQHPFAEGLLVDSLVRAAAAAAAASATGVPRAGLGSSSNSSRSLPLQDCQLQGLSTPAVLQCLPSISSQLTQLQLSLQPDDAICYTAQQAAKLKLQQQEPVDTIGICQALVKLTGLRSLTFTGFDWYLLQQQPEPQQQLGGPEQPNRLPCLVLTALSRLTHCNLDGRDENGRAVGQFEPWLLGELLPLQLQTLDISRLNRSLGEVRSTADNAPDLAHVCCKVSLAQEVLNVACNKQMSSQAGHMICHCINSIVGQLELATYVSSAYM